ncbi:MAG: prephenate dehydrogenase/arogenate dehydrogenase family protein [Candidatus Altiarchaeota archaeon]|nr:prephenate dehydrogenase/arogenate dehydrogenase family protein [Candidatus Altiarchaeota archaeon]
MKAAVVGAGVIGEFLAGLLQERFEVVISDIDAKRGDEVASRLGLEYLADSLEAVVDADLVLVSTPIRETPRVVESIAPAMKEGSLLMDATSIKSHVKESFIKTGRKDIDYISIHPMFCPPTKLKGQNIIVIPVQGAGWIREIKDFFTSKGLRVHESTIERHDEIMALIQVLIHLSFMGINSTIKELGYVEADLRPFMGKFHQMLFDFIPRITSQNHEMYASIQLENPKSLKVCSILSDKIDLFRQLIRGKDLENLVKELGAMSDIYSDPELSIKRSNRLIDLYREEI